MKILLTGASSFTGYWFANELVNSGHQVFATYTRSGANDYEGMAQHRVNKSSLMLTPVWGCKFGDDCFIDLLKKEKFDVLCHHAADVTNYKNDDFNVASAVNNNTLNIYNVYTTLKENDCKAVILTGSVFEQHEGAGNMPLKAFNPYGLSKSLTSDMFKFYADAFDLRLGKFVIPNPFGPYEEPRFTTYLIRNWSQQKTPGVNTPSYIRDNIHVSLLAKAYIYFLNKVLETNENFTKLNPSGYAESQGVFTQRFAEAIRKRTNLECNFEFGHQTDFPEPEIRINTKLATQVCDWEEDSAWNDLVSFYQEHYF
jgi:UDP-glucose 4-epimerase